MPTRQGNSNNVAVLDRPAGGETLADLAGQSTDTDVSNTDTGASTGEQQTGEGASGETASAKAPKRNLDDAPDDEIIGITLRVPNGFRKQLAKTAVEQNTSVPQMLAQMAAEAFSYTLPKPERAPRIKKYDTPEQRKEAQKSEQAKQRLVARKVLEAVEKGIIQVNMADIMKEVETELAAKAAKDAEAAATAAATAGDGAAAPETAGAAS